MRRWDSPCFLLFLFAQHRTGALVFPTQRTNGVTEAPSCKVKPPTAKFTASCDHQERRSFFSTATSGLAALAGLATNIPSSVAAMDLGGATPGSNISNNKRLGGLANKIRGVCNNMVGLKLKLRTLGDYIFMTHQFWKKCLISG